jgi:transposase-like protein
MAVGRREATDCKQTLEPGASVALIARVHGLNANHVFKWRRAFERGELADSVASSTAVLPVTIGALSERVEPGVQDRRDHSD